MNFRDRHLTGLFNWYLYLQCIVGITTHYLLSIFFSYLQATNVHLYKQFLTWTLSKLKKKENYFPPYLHVMLKKKNEKKKSYKRQSSHDSCNSFFSITKSDTFRARISSVIINFFYLQLRLKLSLWMSHRIFVIFCCSTVQNGWRPMF